jgi:hypothetical protein
MKSIIFAIALLVFAANAEIIFAYVPPSAPVNNIPTLTRTTDSRTNTNKPRSSNAIPAVNTPIVAVLAPPPAPTIATPTYIMGRDITPSQTIVVPTV